MKNLILILFIFFLNLKCNSQEFQPVPLNLFDSLFTATINNDYKKFRRQYVSNNEIRNFSYIKELPDSLKIQESNDRTYMVDTTSLSNFNKLKSVIKRYNLTKKNLYSTSFKYISRLNNKTNKRSTYIKNIRFYLVKDSTFISLSPTATYFYKNQLKFLYELDIDFYPKEKEYFEKNLPSTYFIKSIPVNFVEYGNEIYELIKNEDFEELINKFATKSDIHILYPTQEKRDEALNTINRNIERLKKDKNNFKVIQDYVKDKVSVYWKKREYINEPDLRIALYLKTSEGFKLLNLYCIISNNKIMICDITTNLITAMY